MADILFEDIFEVKDIDSGGKKFLRGKIIYLSIESNDLYSFDLFAFSFTYLLRIRIV